jgi:two-component system sensor histidine kinase UhpB
MLTQRGVRAALPFLDALRWLATLVLAWGCGVAWAWPEPAQAQSLTQALVSTTPPQSTPAGAWRPVRLPDPWPQTQPGHSGSVWYRLELKLTPAQWQQWPSGRGALYIERACSAVEVQVNGQLLYRMGPLQEPLGRHCYHPHLVSVPVSVLQAGRNEILLRVAGTAVETLSNRQRAPGLSELHWGPWEALEAHHARERFWHFELFKMAAPALACLGLLLFAFSWNIQHRHPLMLFALMLFTACAATTRVWWTQPPWPTPIMEGLVVSFRLWSALLGAGFLISLAGLRQPWLRWGLAAQAFLLPALVFAAPQGQLLNVVSAVHVLVSVQLIALMGIGAYLMAQAKRPQWRAWATLIPLAAVSMGMEVAAQTGLMEHEWAPLGLIVSPLVWALVGALLMSEVAKGYIASEQARAELEAKVQTVTRDLERNFSRQAQMQVEHAAQAERKRIAGDLHDDLGAKLLTIIHTSGNDRIAGLAREALEEMRLSVRGLTGKPVRLADAMADWRAESVMRLNQARIEARWRAPEEDPPDWLPARTYVQTTRILREALSNVIKHSGANLCKIRLQVGEGRLQLSIRDNGRGIPLELDGQLDRGHGMSSMKQRAKQMQGQCLVESGVGVGTVIRLALPLVA